jgi:hypothetical protein
VFFYSRIGSVEFQVSTTDVAVAFQGHKALQDYVAHTVLESGAQASRKGKAHNPLKPDPAFSPLRRPTSSHSVVEVTQNVATTGWIRKFLNPYRKLERAALPLDDAVLLHFTRSRSALT